MAKKCKGCGKETNLFISLGPTILCSDECYPDIATEIEALRAEGRPVDVALLARKRYKRLHPPKTSTKRVNERNKTLDKMACGLGFDGLSAMLTAWKKGEIKLIVERK